MPGKKSLHGFLQRYITGRYFETLTPETLAGYQFHVSNFRGGVAMEFGAGRNLLTPLLLSHAGATRVYAFDLMPIATVEQINGVIKQLARLLTGSWPQIDSFSELLTSYRIDYRAPGDARDTALHDGSVDFIYSSSTLEHIPGEDIAKILTECKRVASATCRMSFIIDYHDHYGSADSTITRWNFYRFTEREWRKYNPGNHYQNRLRHSEHERLFDEAGLETISAQRVVQPWAESELDRTPICQEFQHSRADLATTNGYFVLAPHAPSTV
jgi:hypothetical protein